MSIKISYNYYRDSEVATSLSRTIAYVYHSVGLLSFIFGGIAFCAKAYLSGILIWGVGGGACWLLIWKHLDIERYFAKKFPSPPRMDPESAPEAETKEYEWAKKIVYDFGKNHPAVKEIAKIKGISKREVINQYEKVIHDYNCKYSPYSNHKR